MKILFVNNGMVGDEPGVSGGETRFIEIAKYWAQQGHEIHILSSEAGRRLCERFGLQVTLHAVSHLKSQTRWTHALRLLQVMFRLPPSIYETSFDVVYSTSELSYDVMPGYEVKKRHPGVRWVVAVHWLPPFPPWKRTGSTLVNSTAFWCNERLGLAIARRHANKLLPVSEDTGKQLLEVKVPQDRFASVECGVLFDKIRAVASRVEQRPVDAVFMKRLQAVKGVFDLIEIWEQVVRVKPQARLAIMGEGLDRDRLETLVKAKGLEKNIEFLGVVFDFETKFTHLAKAKLFVLPSHEENWAIVIGEALAAGTPVICYDLKELRSVWKESCLYVSKHDTRAFAREILRVLEDPVQWAERSRIQSSGRSARG